MNALVSTVQPENSMNDMTIASLKRARSSDGDRITKAAQDFESLFLSQVLKEADETVDYEDDIMYAGPSEEMFRQMMRQELSVEMSRAGGIGLATMVEKTMREQEAGKAKVSDEGTEAA